MTEYLGGRLVLLHRLQENKTGIVKSLDYNRQRDTTWQRDGSWQHVKSWQQNLTSTSWQHNPDVLTSTNSGLWVTCIELSGLPPLKLQFMGGLKKFNGIFKRWGGWVIILVFIKKHLKEPSYAHGLVMTKQSQLIYELFMTCR